MKLQIDVVPQSRTVDLPFRCEHELPQQRGKGARAAAAIIHIADRKQPPLRLLLVAEHLT